MFRFFRKLISIRKLFRKPENGSGEITEEKWVADFSKPKTSRFEIKSEPSYDADFLKFGAKHCLSLGLKKTGSIAWVEAPDRRYRDHIIDARIRLDARGGYAAAGIMFRVVDERTYYSFLISTKGYFRLDLFRNGMPRPLIAWTELPPAAAAKVASEHGSGFTIAGYGSHILILVNGEWAAEISDSSITEGSIGFAAASYENVNDGDEGRPPALLFSALPGSASNYTAETFLESLTVDSRIEETAALYEKWSDSPGIDLRARFCLAETFAAMNQPASALAQITKALKQASHKPRQKELLLAGRLALELGMTAEAEKYIGSCFEENIDSPEGKAAVTEMALVLCAAERYKELKDYCGEALKLKPDDPILKTFLGHACWNLNEYKAAADAYDEAFALDRTNGISAKNAANVYEILGKKKEALERYLEGGRAFLAAENYNDLGLLVPKILALGENNPEARGLAGKWAFGIEDWNLAKAEFDKAEVLSKRKKRHPKDAALVYLRALLFIREGRRNEALPLLEEAADLEKDYPLFRFKLAENRYLITDDPADKKLHADLDAALALSPGDGWMNNFAAALSLRRGAAESAAAYIEKAAAALGEIPEVRMNRAEFLSLEGKLDEALAVLAAGAGGDPGGVMANRAGNLLVKAGRFEEADAKYREALGSGENTGYLFNRVSCLIEIGSYGEADTILARLHSIAPGPDVLELIAYVAVKKGEFARAEAACRSALEMNPDHVPSLVSLGRLLASLSRFDECGEILRRLDALDISGEAMRHREDLRAHYDNLLYLKIKCASCDRSWKVLRNLPPLPGMRLMAMPPDNLPAGTCPECGKTFCIGCAREHLDSSGRFMCPECGKSLKFMSDGLKKIISDWAAEHGPMKKRKASSAGAGGEARGRRSAREGAGEDPPAEPSPPRAKKGRGGTKGPLNKAAPEKAPPETPKRKRGRASKE